MNRILFCLLFVWSIGFNLCAIEEEPRESVEAKALVKNTHSTKCTDCIQRAIALCSAGAKKQRHQRPAHLPFVGGGSMLYSPECVSPCCEAAKIGDDTKYYSVCSKILCDGYLTQNDKSDQCAIGTLCGACGCTFGCNEEQCLAFAMPTVACTNLICAVGPDHETGCVGCGLSIGNCGMLDADKNSLGCFLSVAKQSVYALGQETYFNVLKILKEMCCGALNDDD